MSRTEFYLTTTTSLESRLLLGERPETGNDIFAWCGKLKAIHVPAKAKSWAGMKDWLGIPFVFDGCDFLLLKNLPFQHLGEAPQTP